jgi:hypothetical protein
MVINSFEEQESPLVKIWCEMRTNGSKIQYLPTLSVPEPETSIITAEKHPVREPVRSHQVNSNQSQMCTQPYPEIFLNLLS